MMKALVWPGLVAGISLCVAVPVGAQTPVGALAIDEPDARRLGGIRITPMENRPTRADFE